jgi:hypothetical protein
MMPVLKEHLCRFPTQITIDFMVHSSDLHQMIGPDRIEPWIREHKSYSIFDVEQLLVVLYPDLWNHPISFYLLTHVLSPSHPQQLQWLSLMKPQTFTPEYSDIALSVQNLASALDSDLPTDKVSAICCIQLYILSHVDIGRLSTPCISSILTLLVHPNEWVSAYAVQTVFIWVMDKGYQIDADFVFIIAASAVDRTRPAALLQLYKAMLHLLGVQHDMASTIFMGEPRMRPSSEARTEIQKQKWVYPVFVSMFDKLNELKLIDVNEACKLLGFVMNYLGATDA